MLFPHHVDAVFNFRYVLLACIETMEQTMVLYIALSRCCQQFDGLAK